MASTSEALKEAATGRSVDPSKQLQLYFTQHKSQIEAALPNHLNADRMCRLALTAFHQNKTLMECDPKTVFASVVIASQMGLEIGVSGQGYLVPYKGKCTFIPGWQGLVDLVSRAGRANVWTGAVFDGDEFDYAMGDSPYIKHKPMGESDPARLLYTYAVGRTKGAEWPVIDVWHVDRLRAHFAKFNKVGAAHYAHANWEQYCRKIPLLQVIKYMPKSIEIQNAIQVNDAQEEGHGVSIKGDFVMVEDEEPTVVRGTGSTGGAPASEATQGQPAASKDIANVAKEGEVVKQDAAVTGQAAGAAASDPNNDGPLFYKVFNATGRELGKQEVFAETAIGDELEVMGVKGKIVEINDDEGKLIIEVVPPPKPAARGGRQGAKANAPAAATTATAPATASTPETASAPAVAKQPTDFFSKDT